ncbi:hypothetical protein KL86APRO_12037 [uncultured Alphaproteobacteria bacterium]|uniref:Uncharacterized protein n=1 Tax=uncultured Alphaproteobacteria bacterium TaxID=91750 RepID=A0A212K2J7_9PROT|nr:hypothetical protein KL86APRO_12037 [uncultured Alphaproteobacteria bacterium]
MLPSPKLARDRTNTAQSCRFSHTGFETGSGITREIESGFNAPISAEIDSTATPTKPKDMRALMAQQIEDMKRHHPNEATGCNMFCTWMRKGEIHTQDEGAIP